MMPSVQTGVNLKNEETGVYTVPAFILSVVSTQLAKLTFACGSVVSLLELITQPYSVGLRYAILNGMDNGGTYFDFLSLWLDDKT